MNQLIEANPLTVLNPDYSVGPDGIEAPTRSWLLQLLGNGLGRITYRDSLRGSTSEAYHLLCLMVDAKVFSLWALTTQVAKSMGYELIVEDMGVPRGIPDRYSYMYNCMVRDAEAFAVSRGLPAGNKDII